MTDSQRYLERACSFAAQAEVAASDEGRVGFLRLAGTYAQLARDAATFERDWGPTLTYAADVAA